MENCIFCKIRDNIIKSKKYFENKDFFIIADVNPKAKKHYLMIPKNHYAYLSEQNESDCKILGEMLNILPKLEKTLGIENGYRIIINQKEDGGQEVSHLHVHILGGEKLS